MGIFSDNKASTMYSKCAFHWRLVQKQYEEFAKSDGISSDDSHRALEISKYCKSLEGLLNSANKGLKPKPDLEAFSQGMTQVAQIYGELDSFPEKRHRLLELLEFTPRVLSGNYGSLWRNAEGYNHYWFSD